MGNTQAPTQKRWWGEFPLKEGERGRWRLGPLELWVGRTALDWRYGVERHEDTLESSFEMQVPLPEEVSVATLPEELGRFGYLRTDGVIELLPSLADRPVVARPTVPFHVPPRQKVELFVSTPLWVKLRVGGKELAEVASTRPSDTWFGTNTRGELSYASKTHSRRHLDNIPLRPHRAVSCLTLENKADSVLALERLSLPVPQLSLFSSPTGTLWTEHVSMTHATDGELAEVSLGRGAPAIAGGGTLVAGPRATQGDSFGSLVFGGLFDVSY